VNGYPINCLRCGAAASVKIAAPWSDGETTELKTYSLCCDACLPAELDAARDRRAACPTEPSETLGDLTVFRLADGRAR
jgi:hypothetical protein